MLAVAERWKPPGWSGAAPPLGSRSRTVCWRRMGGLSSAGSRALATCGWMRVHGDGRCSLLDEIRAVQPGANVEPPSEPGDPVL